MIFMHVYIFIPQTANLFSQVLTYSEWPYIFKRAGGIAIIYKNNLEITAAYLNIPKLNNAELLTAYLKINQKKSICISAAYIPPGNNITTAENTLHWITDNIRQETFILDYLNIGWQFINNCNSNDSIHLFGFAPPTESTKALAGSPHCTGY